MKLKGYIEMIKSFVNLTNGIEAIPVLDDFSFIRIQSTTLENQNYYKLFADLDHNLLMWLATGYECKVYDFGTNRPLSKTIYLGVPIIRYCLNKYWLGYEEEKVIAGRNKGMNIKDYVEKEIYQKLFVYHSERRLPAKISLSVKYKYYRRFITSALKQVNLIGVSQRTNHDSDVEFYANVLRETGNLL